MNGVLIEHLTNIVKDKLMELLIEQLTNIGNDNERGINRTSYKYCKG